MTQPKALLDIYGEPIRFEQNNDLQLVMKAVKRIAYAIAALFRKR